MDSISRVVKNLNAIDVANVQTPPTSLVQKSNAVAKRHLVNEVATGPSSLKYTEGVRKKVINQTDYSRNAQLS